MAPPDSTFSHGLPKPPGGEARNVRQADDGRGLKIILKLCERRLRVARVLVWSYPTHSASNQAWPSEDTFVEDPTAPASVDAKTIGQPDALEIACCGGCYGQVDQKDVSKGVLSGPGCQTKLSSFQDLPKPRLSRILETMEVRFTPEQETQLLDIAVSAGTDPERLVKDAALRLLEEDARFRAAVREGIAQADRGDFIDEEQMDSRFEQMLRS